MRAEDERLVRELADLRVTFGRPEPDRSLVLETAGRRVLPVFSNHGAMERWWLERGDADLATRSLTFRTLLANWRAADVDVLLNPGPDGGVRVPVEEARRLLGVVTSKLEPGVEPLPELVVPEEPLAFTNRVIIPGALVLLVLGGLYGGVYEFSIAAGAVLLVWLVARLRRRSRRNAEEA